MALLDGKIAIVTGAARGIGLAIARKFVAEGAKVVLTDIREEGRAHATELGEHAIFLAHDVTQPARWAEVVAEARAHFGPVSVLVNNAGLSSVVLPEDWTEKEYRRIVDINQMSVFFGMHAVLATMRERGGGSIINTSSVAGLVGAPASLPYVAAKFAVTGMTKAAALDLGKYGIRVADPAACRAARARRGLCFPRFRRGELHHRRLDSSRWRFDRGIGPACRPERGVVGDGRASPARRARRLLLRDDAVA